MTHLPVKGLSPSQVAKKKKSVFLRAAGLYLAKEMITSTRHPKDIAERAMNTARRLWEMSEGASASSTVIRELQDSKRAEGG